MAERARIAVIGTGWWATYTHIPAVQAHLEAELVTLCDRDPDRLRAAADAYGVTRRYTDHRAMLAAETLDGVIIATPHATHYAVARDCLSHGLHVLLEKPMTLSAPEARDLVELARAQGRELIIGYTHVFSPHALRARALVQSGALGPVQYVNCVFASRVIEFLRADPVPGLPSAVFPVHTPGAVYSQPALSGGGQGHLQLTHSTGLLFFVTGLRAERVHVVMRNHDLAVDLVDAMAVEFVGGALGSVGGTGNMFIPKFDLHIHCERGAVALDMVAQTLTARGRDIPDETLGPSDEDERAARYATAGNLIAVIHGAANGSPAEVGWRSVEVLDAAYRSARADGQAVTIASLYM